MKPIRSYLLNTKLIILDQL
uniref:Uncharacterized protein n=1 Tax=Arundo donax TaxID=35708 RepID=A0A0A9BMZ4_ARUDO